MSLHQPSACEVCGPDVVLDGNTLPFGTHVFDANQTSAGECSKVLLVEVQNAGALLTRGADRFSGCVDPSPETEPNCEQGFTLTTTVGSGMSDVQALIGNWVGCGDGPICFEPCRNLPLRARQRRPMPPVARFSSGCLRCERNARD